MKHTLFENSLLKTKITSANVHRTEMVLGYFIGPFIALISNAIFGSYLNRYYTDVLGLPPATAGWVFAVALIWDALFDRAQVVCARSECLRRRELLSITLPRCAQDDMRVRECSQCARYLRSRCVEQVGLVELSRDRERDLLRGDAQEL